MDQLVVAIQKITLSSVIRSVMLALFMSVSLMGCRPVNNGQAMAPKRTIAPPTMASKRPKIILYTNRGIDFYFNESGRVRQVKVYSAIVAKRSFVERDQSGRTRSGHTYAPGRVGTSRLGPLDVVPGTGAYGLRIGSDRLTLKGLKDVKSCIPAVNTIPLQSCAILLFEDGRKMIVEIVDGRVQSLLVSGAFKTPEGITNLSTVEQVQRVYGRPGLPLDT